MFLPFRLGFLIDGFSAGGDGELDAIRLPGGEIVPGAAEGADVGELHGGPGLREAGDGGEGIEAGGADAADAFGEDAAVEAGFGGEMALVLLGEGLDAIRE